MSAGTTFGTAENVCYFLFTNPALGSVRHPSHGVPSRTLVVCVQTSRRLLHAFRPFDCGRVSDWNFVYAELCPTGCARVSDGATALHHGVSHGWTGHARAAGPHKTRVERTMVRTHPCPREVHDCVLEGILYSRADWACTRGETEFVWRRASNLVRIARSMT